MDPRAANQSATARPAEWPETGNRRRRFRSAGINSFSLKQLVIAVLALSAIAIHLVLRLIANGSGWVIDLPLYTALLFGGTPLVWDLLVKLSQRQFGSDLLAGISIVTAVLLGEYLAGTLVVLMLSGGEALEAYAVRSASSVLEALSRRMPSAAHRRTDAHLEDVPLGSAADRRRRRDLPARSLSHRWGRVWRGTVSWTNRI